MKKAGAIALFPLIFIIANICFLVFMRGESNKDIYTLTGDIIAPVAAAFAVLGVLTAASTLRANDLVKRSWLVLSTGMVLYLVAEILYAVFELVMKINMDEFFPNAADACWVIGYVPLILGVVMLLWGYRKSGFPTGGKKFYFTLLAGSGLLFYLVWTYLFVPIFSDKGSTHIERFVYAAYLVGDFVLVICCVALAYITSFFKGGALSRPWRFISIGFILITVADIAYSYLTWHGDYSVGGIIDFGWNMGYLLIGMAGFYQKRLIQSINKAG